METTLAELVEAQREFSAGQRELSANQQQFAVSQRALMELQRRQSDSLIELTAVVSRFVDTANARMTRIEENLSDLIRALTAEHKNGKSNG